MNQSQIRKLNCVRCGGLLAVESGRKVVQCGHCHGKNLIVDEPSLARYSLPDRISGKQAESRARDIIKNTRGKPADLMSQIRVEPPRLFWMPYFEISGTRARRIETQKLKRDRISVPVSPSKLETDTRVVLSDFSSEDAAVKMGDWGLANIKITRTLRENGGVPLQPFDLKQLQKKGTVIHPDLSAGQFTEMHTKVVSGGNPMDNRILERETSLIYYPVWRIVFSYRNALFPVVIDGIKGSALFAKIPMDEKFRVIAFLAGAGILGIGLGTALAIVNILGNPLEYLMNLSGLLGVMISVFGLVIFGILAFSWVHLRYSVEIIIDGDRRDIRFIGKTGRTLPEELFVKLADWTHKLMFGNSDWKG